MNRRIVTNILWDSMVRYADKRLRVAGIDPEDLVQESYLRALNALENRSQAANIKPAYFWKTLRSTIIDKIREYERKQKPRRKEEPVLIENPEIDHYLDILSNQERDLFYQWKIKEEGVTWSDLSKSYGLKPATLRKRFSRLSQKLMTELVINWYLQERTEDINRYRLSVAFMRNIADEFYERGLDTSIFQNVFKFEHNNRTIQNATWALAQIGLKNPGALRFLEKQMSSPKLFRGNKTYIAEALIGLDPVHYSNVLREHYFHQINDMDSRIQGTSLPFRQQPAIQSRCLVDVIKYRPLGSEIPANEIENIRKEFLKGTNDVDLHRTLAWILMRSMSDNGKGMITVIESLVDEYDQTNAYYVSKFIMGPGLMMFPSLLLNRRTLQSLRSIKNRWPQNFYFSESAARLSMKIKSR